MSGKQHKHYFDYEYHYLTFSSHNTQIQREIFKAPARAPDSLAESSDEELEVVPRYITRSDTQDVEASSRIQQVLRSPDRTVVEQTEIGLLSSSIRSESPVSSICVVWVSADTNACGIWLSSASGRCLWLQRPSLHDTVPDAIPSQPRL